MQRDAHSPLLRTSSCSWLQERLLAKQRLTPDIHIPAVPRIVASSPSGESCLAGSPGGSRTTSRPSGRTGTVAGHRAASAANIRAKIGVKFAVLFGTGESGSDSFRHIVSSLPITSRNI